MHAVAGGLGLFSPKLGRLQMQSYVIFVIFFCNIISKNNVIEAAATVKLPKNVTVPAVIAFGDSIVDKGNNNENFKTFARCNFLPYGKDLMGGMPTGRYSNGKVPTDFIGCHHHHHHHHHIIIHHHHHHHHHHPSPSNTNKRLLTVEAFGIKELLPAYLDPTLQPNDLLTGVVIAAGGAGYDPLTAKLAAVASLSDQLKQFKEYIEKLKGIVGEEKTNFIIQNSLILVVAGSNDISNTYFLSGVRELEYDVPSYTDFMLKYASDFIKSLFYCQPPTYDLPLFLISPSAPPSSTPHISKSKQSNNMLASNLPKSPFFPTHYVPISCSFHITRNFSQLQTAAEEAVNGRVSERNEIRLGLPSKGRMAADTIDLLKDCQLPIKHVNPRQYVAQIPQWWVKGGLQRDCDEKQNQASQLFNSKLSVEMDHLNKNLPNSRVVYIDIYNSLLDLIINPAKYGFEVANKGCCGTGTIEVTKLCNQLQPAGVCIDDSKYVFWDSYHPTERAYKIIVKQILDNYTSHFI
ncbi:hypothetical protein C1H46_016427 [Malus baccata]|uniref:SGNH hydrolase-type esterase domain-containing protein n=1 Tax=Malus baccata TaxID=106549 RepID=A0A540MH62_MALBA|nr:hypothetical protein C1H46_016427 [Malus baccata]